MIGIFSIYDRATEAFSAPFFQATNAAAIRAVKGEMRNPESQLGQNPTDFELHKLGEWDEQTGAINNNNRERLARLEDIQE